MKKFPSWCLCVLGLGLAGCQNSGHAPDSTAKVPAVEPSGVGHPASEEVILAGNFERVSRATTGRAEIVRRGTDYELVLTAVTVASDAKARVYLVSHDRASSTFLVDSAELKY